MRFVLCDALRNKQSQMLCAAKKKRSTYLFFFVVDLQEKIKVYRENKSLQLSKFVRRLFGSLTVGDANTEKKTLSDSAITGTNGRAGRPTFSAFPAGGDRLPAERETSMGPERPPTPTESDFLGCRFRRNRHELWMEFYFFFLHTATLPSPPPSLRSEAGLRVQRWPPLASPHVSLWVQEGEEFVLLVGGNSEGAAGKGVHRGRGTVEV